MMSQECEAMGISMRFVVKGMAEREEMVLKKPIDLFHKYANRWKPSLKPIKRKLRRETQQEKEAPPPLSTLLW